MKLSDLISPEGKLKAFTFTVPEVLIPYTANAFIGTTCDFSNKEGSCKVVLDVLTILENIETIEKYGELDIMESFQKATDKFIEVVEQIPIEEKPVFVFHLQHAAEEIKQLLDSDMAEEVKKAIKEFDSKVIEDVITEDDTLLEIDAKMESVMEDLFDDDINPFLKKRKKK